MNILFHPTPHLPFSLAYLPSFLSCLITSLSLLSPYLPSFLFRYLPLCRLFRLSPLKQLFRPFVQPLILNLSGKPASDLVMNVADSVHVLSFLSISILLFSAAVARTRGMWLSLPSISILLFSISDWPLVIYVFEGGRICPPSDV